MTAADKPLAGSTSATVAIRDAQPEEFAALGALMVSVYSALDGFPTPEEQPHYYEMLAAIGDFTKVPSARLLVADIGSEIVGGVVYFGDMAHYGSGGLATTVANAAGIRLLAVDPAFRGRGIGRALTHHCIEIARRQSRREVILHTTAAMRPAWEMYESIGFVRSPDLDFLQQDLPVFGFRLQLADHPGAKGKN